MIVNLLVIFYFIVNGFIAGYYTHEKLIWCKNKFERTIEIMWIVVMLFFGSLFLIMEQINNFFKK